MGTLLIQDEVAIKLNAVRSLLKREIVARGDVCLTCSFQAEDVLLTKLAIALDPAIPILFLDTGYHFRETYEYRDRIAKEWKLNLVNLLPEKTVAEQEAEHGLLYQSAQG
jgi:phosphoadenosine phosphosulfate reductase